MNHKIIMFCIQCRRVQKGQPVIAAVELDISLANARLRMYIAMHVARSGRSLQCAIITTEMAFIDAGMSKTHSSYR